MSAYCRALLLRTMFGQSSNVPLGLPAEAWLALARSTITAQSAGWSLDEPTEPVDVDGVLTETMYARASIGMGPAKGAWDDSGLSGVVNGVEIRFPKAAAPWGTLKFWSLMDAAEGGRVLVYGALAQKYTVIKGDIVIVSPGALRVGLDSYDMEW